MTRPIDTVVFDLDGTLADTSGDLIAAANACFRPPLAPPLDPTRDQLVAFEGGRAMLRLGFSRLGQRWDETDIDRHYPDLLRFYGENIATHTVLYGGVVDLLARLSRDGFNLGICTNKPEALAETLLQTLGIRRYFKALIGADTLSTRKPHPTPLLETIARLGGRPENAVLIGDTATDRDTGRAAGVTSVLVTFGPRARDVAALAPEALLGHFDDLPALLTRLRP